MLCLLQSWMYSTALNRFTFTSRSQFGHTLIILEYIKLFLGINLNEIAPFRLTMGISRWIPCWNWKILQTDLEWRQVLGRKPSRAWNYNWNASTLYIAHKCCMYFEGRFKTLIWVPVHILQTRIENRNFCLKYFDSKRLNKNGCVDRIEFAKNIKQFSILRAW